MESGETLHNSKIPVLQKDITMSNVFPPDSSFKIRKQKLKKGRNVQIYHYTWELQLFSSNNQYNQLIENQQDTDLSNIS